ncbi:MAG: aminotransferase class IV family protein [Candidatus Solibacter usitatus]|nr:aminotransferase class IV family protein [Candidatus Solibacter usitatus]
MIRPLILHNGQIRPAGELCLAPGQVGLFSGWGIFSTIKISSGVLFAFDRHWARMRKDADLLRIPFPWTPPELEKILLSLVAANQDYDATLRVLVVRNSGTMWAGPPTAQDADLVAFTAARSQWGSSARLGIVPNARHAESLFSGAKTTSWAMNLVWYEEAHLRGQDEVVLLNEHGEVSECTSANIFAVFGDTAATPPLTSGCLPGITRELLLEVIRVPGVRVVERPLTLDDLENADGLFITSTTRDLLPVSHVEGLAIKSCDRVRAALAAAFHAWQEDYAARAPRRASPATLG